MRNFKTFFSLALLLSLSQLSIAQWEIGVLGGASTYSGEINRQNTFYSTGDYNAAFGGFARYTFHPLVSARVGINYTKLSASDSKSTDGIRINRNLSFQSTILEFSLVAELNVPGYQPYNLARPWSLYIFGGIGGFAFNPQAELEGQLYDLQSLGTEGQGLEGRAAPYKLFELNLPMGGGIKYALNDRWNIGLELGLRYTFTDYIDDVSGNYVPDELLLLERGPIAQALANRSANPVSEGQARGNDSYDDFYVIGGLTISYNLTDNGLVGSRGRSKRSKKGCPTNF